MSNELKKLCGLPTRLSEAGVTEDQLDSIAEKAINDGAISFSPVEVSLEEARKILKAAF
jgi:alcohol dehydrogenase